MGLLSMTPGEMYNDVFGLGQCLVLRQFLQLPSLTNAPERMLRAIAGRPFDHRAPVFGQSGCSKKRKRVS